MCKKVLNAGSGLASRLPKAYNQLVKSVTGNQSQGSVNDPLTLLKKNKNKNNDYSKIGSTPPCSVVKENNPLGSSVIILNE